MMHNFTSLLSSIPGPSQETILALQLFARTFKPSTAENLEDRWFDEHALA